MSASRSSELSGASAGLSTKASSGNGRREGKARESCGSGVSNASKQRPQMHYPLGTEKADRETLEGFLFGDPSQWWDHRSEKVNAKYPDFKHKKTQDALWVDGRSNPSWVEAALAAMAAGTVQCNIFSWNKRLSKLAKGGQYELTINLFRQMEQSGISPDKLSFIPVLNACANLGALQEGKLVHAQILKSGSESDIYVSCSLLDMYAKCGSIDEAWRVFKNMPSHDVVSWNAMILGCVKCGQGRKALELFDQMEREGVKPVSGTFVGILNACASLGALAKGYQVHEQIIQCKLEADVSVGTSLIDMYAKCGSIDSAWTMFDKMSERGPDTWNAMILGFVKCGQGHKALELAGQMRQATVVPDRLTFVGILNACASVAALEEGLRVHEEIIAGGLQSDIYVANSLLDLYSKCERMENASQVFQTMSRKDVVTWNTMIAGYVKCGQADEALKTFEQMKLERVTPDTVTFMGLLNACASLGDLNEGRRIHEEIVERGFERQVFVGSSLVDMYAKCGSIEDASTMFNRMPLRDVVAWNTMILAHVKCGEGPQALELWSRMEQEGFVPVRATFVAGLSACASIGALADGRRIHERILERGFESDESVGNSLIDMYTKCGGLEDASIVFKRMPIRNICSWNAMILGYVSAGQGHKALELFQKMRDDGVEPVPSTLVTGLNACASIGALEQGRLIHEQAKQIECESDIFVGSSLVDMYCKCGSIDDAWKVFSEMSQNTVISCNAMILGYVKHGHGEKALKIFQEMQQKDLEPDCVTFVGALNACASIGALAQGRLVHEQIIRAGFESNRFVHSSLVDMYAKCGSLDDASAVFKQTFTRDVVAWNAMLGGYATHGQAMDALEHFVKMCEHHVQMDVVTFVSLLSSCSHAGLVDEGLHLFQTMKTAHNVSRSLEHYACIVDLLGRSGHLYEAEDLIKQMAGKADASVWMSLLGACRVHGNVSMGERVAERYLEMQPADAAGYVILSNIHAAAGDWASQANVQQLRVERGVRKQPGLTWIEVNGEVHSFTVDSQDHPRINEIRSELGRLYKQMQDGGYVPDTRFVLHDVGEGEKVGRLCYHSERLAIAFGILATPAGTPIHIFKNLRVCGDCHDATKLITKLVGRRIVVRDANRFHHFENGVCSCKDFW